MLRPRQPGFFEEIGTGDIEILGDSRFVEKFSFDADADISEDVTLFKRSTVKRAPPRLPKNRDQLTDIRPVPEALLRHVRERARTSVAPRAAVANAADKTHSRIRRAVVLPWPAALMVLAVLAAVLVPHARRGDTRGALLYTLSSTRNAMTLLRHPSALLAGAPAITRDVKAVRKLREARPNDEYLTITFAAPAVKAASQPEPVVTAPPKAKPAVAKKTPHAEAAKADALVRAQLE
ncbi:MAG: hypothetical protein ABIP39_02025 [Polyangiaceae bacterium]